MLYIIIYLTVQNGRHEKLVQQENHEMTTDQLQDVVENQFVLYSENYIRALAFFMGQQVTFNKSGNIFRLWNVVFPA